MEGLQSFQKHIQCRHEQGVANDGVHRRSVYRIGLGTKDKYAGYSHAFMIVAQPDGSFYWLQSFINRYSLQKWMSKQTFEGPVAHMSLQGLKMRLSRIERLMQIRGWTAQANLDYAVLFDVDFEKEATGITPVRSSWQPSHRLYRFIWDEACEYPVPGDEKKGANGFSSLVDQCTIESMVSMVKSSPDQWEW